MTRSAMNLNVGVIDQQVRGLAQRLGPRLAEAMDRSSLDETLARGPADASPPGPAWWRPCGGAGDDRPW